MLGGDGGDVVLDRSHRSHARTSPSGTESSLKYTAAPETSAVLWRASRVQERPRRRRPALDDIPARSSPRTRAVAGPRTCKPRRCPRWATGRCGRRCCCRRRGPHGRPPARPSGREHDERHDRHDERPQSSHAVQVLLQRQERNPPELTAGQALPTAIAPVAVGLRCRWCVDYIGGCELSRCRRPVPCLFEPTWFIGMYWQQGP